MSRPPIVRPDLGGPFPEHIAVIMDGNGRWAEERGMRRIEGHREGIDSVREITTECAQHGSQEPDPLCVLGRELEAAAGRGRAT